MENRPERRGSPAAIASDPQRNLDFYYHVLGLRLIKQTVNFDAPEVYHLYYGNERGDPGTVLTFFPWPDTPQGRRGTGQATTTSLSVPTDSLGWWHTHLQRLGIDVRETTTRFDEAAWTLHDPDGLLLELVAYDGADPNPPWEHGPIPLEHATRGFHSVTLTEADGDTTGGMFLDTLGFTVREESAGRYRFGVGEGGSGEIVDVIVDRPRTVASWPPAPCTTSHGEPPTTPPRPAGAARSSRPATT